MNVLVSGSQYQDVGLAVEGLSMAAGATVYSPWIDNISWVRNAVMLAQSDQQYDVVTGRRDTAGTSSIDSSVAATQTATSLWRLHTTNVPFGYSGRVGIKNSSASANTYARIRLQLLGQ